MDIIFLWGFHCKDRPWGSIDGHHFSLGFSRSNLCTSLRLGCLEVSGSHASFDCKLSDIHRALPTDFLCLVIRSKNRQLKVEEGQTFPVGTLIADSKAYNMLWNRGFGRRSSLCHHMHMGVEERRGRRHNGFSNNLGF